MTAQLQPYVNTRETSPFRFLGLATVMRSTAETTGGAFALMEHWDMPPGFATPYHTHHREDEAFYILAGEVAFICDGKWLKAGAGSYVYGPREIPHGFKIIGSSPAQMLLVCAPGGGFERFVLEQAQPIAGPPSPPDMAKLLELAAKYNIDIHGPLPDEPAGFGSATGDPESLNRRWIQAFNDRDWETERSLRSSNFQAYLSGSEKPLDNSAWSGFMIQFTTAFPDSHISIDSVIAAGDRVSTMWTLTGTHKGVFQGIPPTGRSVKFTGIEFNRIADGKIADHWSQFDLVSLMQQIGPA